MTNVSPAFKSPHFPKESPISWPKNLRPHTIICSPHTIVLSGPTTPLKQSLLESRTTSIITKSNGHFSVFRWSQSRFFFFLRGRLQCLLSLLNHVLPRSSLTYLPYFSLSFISLQAHSRIHRHEMSEYLKVQS